MVIVFSESNDLLGHMQPAVHVGKLGWIPRAKGSHGCCQLEDGMAAFVFASVCPGWSVETREIRNQEGGHYLHCNRKEGR